MQLASQQSSIMSQPSSQPQAGLASGSFRSYSEQNTRMNNEPPQIYSAVYSGVDVYEMEVNDVAVMRRRNDSCLNATQILKVAGVDKGKRTKILEKEIQTGEHEKVQGGYGKYQGTWISFKRAVEVCRQYGVEEILRPLLTYDMGQDGGVAGRGDLNTPTKEQAMAAQRKRMYSASSDIRNANNNGTFFKGISSTAGVAVAAISKARFDSPGPRNRIGGLTRAPSFNRQSSMASVQGAADEYQGGNSQTSNFSENFPPPDANTAFSAGSGPQPIHGEGLDQPPRKRPRLYMTPANSFGQYPQANGQMQSYADAFPGSPTEPNDSFIYTQHAAAVAAANQVDAHDPLAPLPPLPYESGQQADQKRSKLMALFMEGGSEQVQQQRQAEVRSMSARDMDLPIDSQRHTALHWAATLGQISTIRTLLAGGANPFRVNSSGETALMRACIVTNSHDLNTMPELLDALGSTIEVQDSKGRTVLHHIALTSAVKGRSSASRYYLQCLLEWVVRQGGVQANNNYGGSQGSGQAGPSSQSQQQNPARLGLARFMNEMLNAQDNSGDTALNIAARIGTRSIISQLLEVCASPYIANRAGLRPIDFGIGLEEAGEGGPPPGGDGENGEGTKRQDSCQKSRESGDEIVSSITHLLTETGASFQQEMKAKQQGIDALHTTLRATSAQLAEARRQADSLQERVKQQLLARQKMANLSRAREQEQYRVMQLEQRHGRRGDASASNGWEAEIKTLQAGCDALTQQQQQHADAGGASLSPNSSSQQLLPSAALLRARVKAMRSCIADTNQATLALRSRSREHEHKYRRLVGLATSCAEADVDEHLDGLMRAIESEKGDLELGRVKRFLYGVEGVAV